jgi:hypothetical protein
MQEINIEVVCNMTLSEYCPQIFTVLAVKRVASPFLEKNARLFSFIAGKGTINILTHIVLYNPTILPKFAFCSQASCI